MNRVVKNWITSALGIILMFTALGLYVGHKYGVVEMELTMLELAGMLVLGYVFLMAKDSLITGLFMGIFKVNAKEDEPAKVVDQSDNPHDEFKN